jgi:hypothetical protein
MNILLKCLLLITIFTSYAFADENKESADNYKEESDATFDKRLPPVFPGETISDGKRKMKVWSTSGPVPVSSINSGNINVNPNRRGNRGNQPVNVIVDKRN